MQNESPAPERPAGPVYGDLWHREERNWAMLLHLSALSGLVTSGLGSILGPLIVWLIFRGKSDMVNFHGKKALNFNISLFIYYMILIVFMIPFFVIGSIAEAEQEIVDGFWETLALFGISGIVMIIFAIIWFIWLIVATVRASRGDRPGYILAIPFLR